MSRHTGRELSYSGAQRRTKAPRDEERAASLAWRGDGRGLSNAFHWMGSGRGLKLHQLSTSHNSETKQEMGGL